MKQRILIFFRRFQTIDGYGLNLDEITEQLNSKGWLVKQIISTSFNHETSINRKYPVFVISLLVEKTE